MWLPDFLWGSHFLESPPPQRHTGLIKDEPKVPFRSLPTAVKAAKVRGSPREPERTSRRKGPLPRSCASGSHRLDASVEVGDAIGVPGTEPHHARQRGGTAESPALPSQRGPRLPLPWRLSKTREEEKAEARSCRTARSTLNQTGRPLPGTRQSPPRVAGSASQSAPRAPTWVSDVTQRTGQ